ncbi:hypothetical protein GCM10027044_19200 [Hymenobacter ruber]
MGKRPALPFAHIAGDDVVEQRGSAGQAAQSLKGNGETGHSGWSGTGCQLGGLRRCEQNPATDNKPLITKKQP